MSDIAENIERIEWTLRDPEWRPSREYLEKLLAAYREAAAEIERLRAALKPFAMLEIHPSAPDDGLVIVTDVAGGIIDTGRNRMTVADVREARRALEAKQ